MSKYKRTLWIVFAIVFIVTLFFIKNKTTFKNIFSSTENGLTYSSETLEDSVNKDTDGDGILDWQEILYQLDPTKKETTSGTPDTVAISRLKALEEDGGQGKSILKNIDSQGAEKLNQTEKFSRELFATMVTANQNGTMDEAAIEKLSASLADNIQNSAPRKIFLVFDIKIINDSSIQALTNYNKALNSIYLKYPPMNYTILDVLQKFMIDENNVDVSALKKLDPIIDQTKKIIDAMLKTTAPQSVSTLHLNVINSLERILENISDMKLYESDAIMALGGISKYQDNATRLESDFNSLARAIGQKLSN